MGVYIKGLKLPSAERQGELLILTDDGRCVDMFSGEYEAVELPQHGRLGDLDKLEQMFVDIDNAPYSAFDGEEPFYTAEDAAQIIRLAPTIIEREGGT